MSLLETTKIIELYWRNI